MRISAYLNYSTRCHIAQILLLVYSITMDNNLIFEQKRNITSAFIDSSVRLGIAQSVLLIQDNLTECFNMLGCDGIVYREKYNAFWVFTKTRVKFFHRPDWRTQVTAKTFPVSNEGLRTNVNTIITDKEGKTLLVSNQEACVLDMEKHRPLRIKTPLPYPTENFPERVMNEPFEKFPDVCANGDFVYEHIVRSTQIDMSHHLNNIEYIKLALNIFSDDFLQTHEVATMEVHYTGESREGQTLQIFKHEENGATFVAIRESERIVFEMKIEFSPKQM